jgi:hypothetical protein
VKILITAPNGKVLVHPIVSMGMTPHGVLVLALPDGQIIRRDPDTHPWAAFEVKREGTD